MGKPAKEIRMTLEFSQFFDKLDDGSKLRNEVLDLAGLLKLNCTAGNSIPHNRWPKIYIKEYKIKNLFRCELSDGWRLLYHIVGEPDGLVVYFIEGLPHKEYDLRFGY